eukprot:758687-Hanusia_phi.AAC.1
MVRTNLFSSAAASSTHQPYLAHLIYSFPLPFPPFPLLSPSHSFSPEISEQKIIKILPGSIAARAGLTVSQLVSWTCLMQRAGGRRDQSHQRRPHQHHHVTSAGGQLGPDVQPQVRADAARGCRRERT